MSKEHLVFRRVLLLTALFCGCGGTAPDSARESTETANPADDYTRFVRVANAGLASGYYTRIALWLLHNLLPEDRRQDPEWSTWLEYRRAIIGMDFRDGLLKLADGKAEVALVNSSGVTAMAFRGAGLFDRPLPIRGIAVVPEDDWAFFVVDASLGIRSFADLREQRIPLRISSGFRNSDSAQYFYVREILRRHGVEPEEFQAWGGEFVGSGGPSHSRADWNAGKAEAIFQEGTYPDLWVEAFRDRPVNFLSLDPTVAAELEEELGVPTRTVPANTYANQPEPFIAVDFSGFNICVREDTNDALASRLAQIVAEKGAELDSVTRYLSVNSPLLLPRRRGRAPFGLDPPEAVRTPIPLHPAAERYYRERGLIE